MSALTDTLDPRLIPGAMQESKSREIPDLGLIEFEFAPAGWLAKNGQPRLRDWRAYYFTPLDGKRGRFPSVSTMLDAIFPKGGLPVWTEARGIEGAVEAVRRGEIDPQNAASAARAVDTVRALRLGADRARDDAADRGLNVHACLETYNLTGEPPNPADHPEEHWGYLRALTRWLLKADPEPVAIEQLVAHGGDGYAGRLDLRARIGGLLTTVDLKTSERGQIFAQAHVQAALYERAAVWCGDEPASAMTVVVCAADGEFREMPCAADERAVDAALAWYRCSRPIDSVCESANRAEKKARAAA